MLANTGVDLGMASTSAGHCGPVCSSCSAPDTNTGTCTWVAHADMDRRSKSDGSRPGPVAGATSAGPTRDSRLSAWSWSAWLARQVDDAPPLAVSSAVDLVVGPRLADVGDRRGGQRDQRSVRVGGGRLGVVDPRVDPAGGEAVVEDPSGVAGREQVVGRAHGGDGGQAGRVGARGGELGEPRVADADHPHLVVGHPRLVGHDLDRVVGVVVRGIAEEVEGSARAARYPASAG